MAPRSRKTTSATTTDTVAPNRSRSWTARRSTSLPRTTPRAAMYEIHTRRDGKDVLVRSAGRSDQGRRKSKASTSSTWSRGSTRSRSRAPTRRGHRLGPRPFRLHNRVTGTEEPSQPPTVVTLTPRKAEASASNALWEEIRIWSEQRRFENYELFIRDQICPTNAVARPGLAAVAMDDIVKHTRDFLAGELNGEQLENVPVIDVNRLAAYDADHDIVLPYLTDAAAKYPELQDGDPCDGIDSKALTVPFAVELIWSYWHEEGGLVQTLNHILARFQNRRTGPGPDPMARFDLSPLRPLRNLLFEWAESEVRPAHRPAPGRGVRVRVRAEHGRPGRAPGRALRREPHDRSSRPSTSCCTPRTCSSGRTTTPRSTPTRSRCSTRCGRPTWCWPRARTTSTGTCRRWPGSRCSSCSGSWLSRRCATSSAVARWCRTRSRGWTGSTR